MPHRKTGKKEKKRNTARSSDKDRHGSGGGPTGRRLNGILSVNSHGVGYVPAPGFENDVEIENHFLKTALNGDEIEFVLHPKVKNQRQHGEVVKIVSRAKMEFVGTVEKGPKAVFLLPDDKKMYVDILLQPEETRKLKDGTKVLAKIVSWRNQKENPVGTILRELGHKGEHEVEMQSIILERGIIQDFTAEVEREAQMLARHGHPIDKTEIAKRRDVRSVPTCTIDPLDAKDFDDALSIRKLENGRYEIGVHIADVSHYVKEGSALDREARKRGFSVYLVDRTIPMLPEVLSNDLCSLNPNEDKLAFSTIFEIDDHGHVFSRWFGKTVIRSDKRFTYEEAQQILDDAKPKQKSSTVRPEGSGKAKPLHWELSTLNRIAKKLSAARYTKGAIDFDTAEIKFKLDRKGRPIDIYVKPRLDTHKLIEEFMLLSNREVAEYIYRLDEKAKRPGGSARRPFIYRIHDLPDKDRLAELSLFAEALGFTLGRAGKEITPADISKLLGDISGASQETLLKTAVIRSMSKAIYSTRNIGHFGLSFRFYTHFTSPIRRYPDLIVHRLLYKYLAVPKAGDDFVKYEKIALETSQKEVRTAEAERASIKYKQVEYLKDHVGEIFDGVISGVTEWGVYIEEAKSKAEGMVKVRDINGDFYELDEKSYSLVGRKKGRRYTLGDKVKVKLVAADLDRKTLDFVFV